MANTHAPHRRSIKQTMPTNLIVAVIGAIVAVATSFATASATSDSHVNAVDTKVQILEQKQADQYTEVKNDLNDVKDSQYRMEKKIDALAGLKTK